MVNHNGDILLESFVFCHPQNVIDYVSVRTSNALRGSLSNVGSAKDGVEDDAHCR